MRASKHPTSEAHDKQFALTDKDTDRHGLHISDCTDFLLPPRIARTDPHTIECTDQCSDITFVIIFGAVLDLMM